MNKLHEFIQAEQSRKLVQEELTPLQERMSEIMNKIRNINNDLSFWEKDLIKLKLWEAFSSDQKEKVQAQRDERDAMFNSDHSSYCANFQDVFDPLYDDWHLVTFEMKDNKIRFQVSCNRREGTISGLVTFLDTYWTAWFDVSELDK